MRGSRDASQSPSSCSAESGSRRTSSPSRIDGVQVTRIECRTCRSTSTTSRPEELSAETRTFARICASLIEEAEAIGWYAQRLDVEKDEEARAIMENAQGEEFKHFAMNLEFLIRRTPKWREVLEDVLFKEGDIVEHGEQAEDAL